MCTLGAWALLGHAQREVSENGNESWWTSQKNSIHERSLQEPALAKTRSIPTGLGKKRKSWLSKCELHSHLYVEAVHLSRFAKWHPPADESCSCWWFPDSDHGGLVATLTAKHRPRYIKWCTDIKIWQHQRPVERIFSGQHCGTMIANGWVVISIMVEKHDCWQLPLSRNY